MSPLAAADRLRAARVAGITLDPFTDLEPELDEAWAYSVQELDRDQRIAEGDALAGAKLGLTSEAKQRRVGVDRPIVGFLSHSMLVVAEDVGSSLSRWVQPRIEPEIAFVTGRPIVRRFTADDAPAYVGTVSVAAEIIDSRWTGYRFRLPDVVADNTSAAGVVVGLEPVALSQVGDLSGLACGVTVDGQLVHEATGAAILGNPMRALAMLSEHLEGRGESLPSGSLVLAGALTDAVPLVRGARYELSVRGLGVVSVDT
jgi:2-oxo-3-hexenedioate decarboxylase